MKSLHPVPSRREQRGAIAIIVGLSLAVLIGFAGLALDGGRLYLTKTELQNAADACALAAAYELSGALNIPADNFTHAKDAGLLVAVDEVFEVLTLVQTRKVRPLPIVLVGEEFWRRAIDIDFLVAEGTIAPEDARLVRYVETGREAWTAIRTFYRLPEPLDGKGP